MSNDEVISLLLSYRRTQEAEFRDKIVKGNIRLIVWAAHRYRTDDLALSDLVQEGVVGFMEGLDRFDMTRVGKGRVCNYALLWSKKSILYYITYVVPRVYITQRVVDSARRALKRLDKAVQEWECNEIALDLMLQDRPRSERIGSLDVFAKNGLGAASLDEEWQTREDYAAHSDYGGSTPRFSKAMRREATPPQCEPVGEGDKYYKLTKIAMRALDGGLQALIYSCYGVAGYPPFAASCKDLGITETEGKILVEKNIEILKGGQPLSRQQPRSPFP